MLRMSLIGIVFFLGFAAACVADGKPDNSKPQPKAQGLDMVSDTVSGVFNKANALLAGDLEITMPKDERAAKEDFTINAMGQKVPTRTAIKSGSALHNDDPL
jgi:hypothetical protein